MNFTGVFPILATPFRDDESFDESSMRNMVEIMARLGVDGVTVLGVPGGLYGQFDLEAGSDGYNTGFAFPEVLQSVMPGVDITRSLDVAAILSRD